MTLVKKTVDEWLNEIDYNDDLNYVPSTFSLEFVSFIKLVNGVQGEEHKTPVVHYKMIDKIAGKVQNTANMCSRGLAKSLSLTTQVFTDVGYSTIGAVQVGDQIMGENGQLTTITHKSSVFNKPMYRITLKDGRELKVSEDHINTVIQKRKVRYGGRKGYCKTEYSRRDLTTKELLQYQLLSKRKITKKNPTGVECNFWIPNCSAIEYSPKPLPIDPYTLGLLIGDGSMDRETGYARLHGHKDDFTFYTQIIPYKLGHLWIDKRNTNVITQGVLGLGKDIKQLKLNVHGNHKFIPEMYKFGSLYQRLELLKGLMDTDGTCYLNGGVSFTSNSHQLCKDLMELVRSIGGIASIAAMNNSYRVAIRINTNIFKLPRKFDRFKSQSVEKVGIISIESIAPEPSQCIAVNNVSNTFVVNDYIVTHNTTIFAEYLFLYLAVYGSIPGFGEVDYALYVSDSIENGVKKMRLRMERRCEKSDFLKRYISVFKFTDIRWYFQNKEGKEFVVTGHGAKTGVRGTVELNTRPHLAVLDDLLGDEDAKSATIIENVENTVYSAIDYALHPTKRKVIWSGTPFNARDPLYKAIESGVWYVNVYPVCETFPCSREQFRGAWPDRFGYDYVKAQYDKSKGVGKLDSFNQELMLRIMSPEDRLIDDSDIVWYKRRNVLHHKDAYNFYITTDFATSDKQHADFSVINVWAYNNNGDWLWVDGVCQKVLMNVTIDSLFRLVQEYRPQEVGIEISGQQKGFISWIQNEMGYRNNYFTLSKGKTGNDVGITPSKDKVSRFRENAVPLFKAKKIWLPEELKESEELTELLLEISLATLKGFKSKHDDALDTITMLAELNSWRPSEVSTSEEENYEPGSTLWDIEDTTQRGEDSYFVQ